MEGRREKWERVRERRRKGRGGVNKCRREGGMVGGSEGERWERGREVGGKDREEEGKTGLEMCASCHSIPGLC